MLLIDRLRARKAAKAKRKALATAVFGIDIGAVFADYATALGKDIKSMTVKEKRQAVLNGALEYWATPEDNGAE